MNNKQIVTLILIASLLGGVCGAVFTYVFISNPIFAQVKTTTGNVVSAPEFALIDAKGNVRIRLTMAQDDSANLAFYDRSGKTQAQFVIPLAGKPSLIYQSKGHSRTIWSAPHKD